MTKDEQQTKVHSSLKTVEWKDNKVVMIDQTKLPNKLEFVEFSDYHQVADAIKNLVVRGAPAIGVSGAFGLALAVLQSNAQTKDDLIRDLDEAKKILIQTRPTAVNLKWGLEKIMSNNMVFLCAREHHRESIKQLHKQFKQHFVSDPSSAKNVWIIYTSSRQWIMLGFQPMTELVQ